jgi:tight adherence protein B
MTEARAADVLAAVAGALLALSAASYVRDLRAFVPGGLARLSKRAQSSTATLVQPFQLAGEEGTTATDSERLRLQAVSALGGFAVGLALVGMRAGLVLGILCAWLGSKSLVWARQRYRRRIDSGASAVALALADALEAGHSVRGAISVAAYGLAGPASVELRRVADELEVGARTEQALEGFRRRAASRRLDLIVAAARIQRRSGGSLARLMRDIAATIDEQDRLADEARAASAQARFTSVVVLFMPFAGLALAELAAPGIVPRIAGSAAGAWLLGCALALQLLGVVLIRRLSRIDA